MKNKVKNIKTSKLKNKAITLFAVVNSSDINDKGICDFTKTKKFYTITDSYENCEEYICLREIDEHQEHYGMWCAQRHLDPTEENNWDIYSEVVLGDNSEYGIIQFQIEWEDLIAFMRMFQGCYPIDCSFDRPVEKVYFGTQLENIFKDTLNKQELEDNTFEEKKINPEDIIQ